MRTCTTAGRLGCGGVEIPDGGKFTIGFVAGSALSEIVS